MKQEILNYIKDCKEKGYEAGTILKGLEAKLEIEQEISDKRICLSCGKQSPDTPCPYCGGGIFKIEKQDTSENWEQKFDKWAESFVVDFVSDDAGEEYNVYLKDTPFYEEFKDFIRKTRQEAIEEEAKHWHRAGIEAQKLAKKELIEDLIEWAEVNKEMLKVDIENLINHLKNIKI